MALRRTSGSEGQVNSRVPIATATEAGVGAHIFWLSGDGTIKHQCSRLSPYSGLPTLAWGTEETVYTPGNPITGGLTALSRYQGHIEVFWIAGTSVMAAFLEQSTRKWVTWTVRSEPGLDPAAKSGLTAIAPGNDTMELFWVNGGSAVCGVSYIPSNHGWGLPYAVTGPHTAAILSSIVAVSREGNGHREVFFTTPEGGIKAAYSYNRGNFAVWEAVSDKECANTRGAIHVISPHKDRMALFWIHPSGSIKARYWQPQPSWGTVEEIASAKEEATGSVKVIDRRPQQAELSYELAWTRKDGTIGSATITGPSDDLSKKVVQVRTLPYKSKLAGPRLALAHPYTGGSLLIMPEETTQKLAIAQWVEQNTASASAEINLIEKGPAFESHLNVNLQGYHQAISVSQANINATLAYNFSVNKSLLEFKFRDGPDDEYNFGIDATLAPPTVRLRDRADGLDGAWFFLNFARGTFERYSKKERGYIPTNVGEQKWSIAFLVTFSKQKLDVIPPAIKDKIQTPGSYSATQLAIDFATVDLASFDWEMSSIAPFKTSKDEDLSMKAHLKGFIDTYLLTLSSTKGPHNILGYALEVKPGIDPPATFTPQKVRLQVVDNKPVQGVTLSEKANQDRSAFVFTEMLRTKDSNADVPFPAHDLTWTGSLFFGSIQGSLILSRSMFLEKYMVPKLAMYNSQMLTLANEIWHLLANPETKEMPWMLTAGARPADSTLGWTMVPRDGAGASVLAQLAEQFAWLKTLVQESMHGKRVAAYRWSEYYDRNKGGMDYKCIGSTVTNSVYWSPGSGWLSIETTMELVDARTEYEIFKSVVSGLATVVTGGAGGSPVHSQSRTSVANVSFTTLIKLSNIETGGLNVDVEVLQPVVATTISADSQGLFNRVFGSDPTKANSELAQRVKSKVKELFAHSGLAPAIKQELNVAERFFFPGGGTFQMKDPVFTQAGDLAVGLTYILNNGRIVREESA